MFTWIKLRAAIRSPLLQNIENQAQKVRPSKMKKGLQTVILRWSDPGGIQTHDRLLRRQELYSAELPGQNAPPTATAGRRKSPRK
jgi:hypothetical protein